MYNIIASQVPLRQTGPLCARGQTTARAQPHTASPTPALIVIRKKKIKEWEAVANCLFLGILQEANGTQIGDTRDTFLKKAKTNNAAPGSAWPRICTQPCGDVRAWGFND